MEETTHRTLSSIKTKYSPLDQKAYLELKADSAGSKTIKYMIIMMAFFYMIPRLTSTTIQFMRM